MKYFVDVYPKFVLIVLSFFTKAPGFSIPYSFASIPYFVAALKWLLKVDIFSESTTLHSRLPALHRVRFAVKIKDTHINSVSAFYDKDIAAVKAEGEFLERVSSCVPIEEGVLLEQVMAQSILGSSSLSTSLSHVYWGVSSTKTAKKTKHQVTTSGVAGHFNKAGAIVSAWLELIERDAFLMYWLHTISPRHVDVKNIGSGLSPLSKLIQETESKGITYYFLDITSDIQVPVCACIVILESTTGPKVGVGAKAGFDTVAILEGALVEALGVLETVLDAPPYMLPENYRANSGISITKSERVRLYTTTKGYELLSFFLRSTETTDTESFSLKDCSGIITDSQKLLYLKNIFNARLQVNKAYDVFVYEFKNKLLSYFDYHVVRVMCEGLYPLYLQETYLDPHHPRLQEFVQNKGLESGAQLNTIPHPFP